jgi:hypothetical protein
MSGWYVTASETTALITASTAALLALLGYWVAQYQKRQERRSEIFASALRVVREYEQLPYLIRRREEDGPATRARLTNMLSRSAAERRYYETLLRLDSPLVADAYRLLLKRTAKKGGPFRAEAWRSPIIRKDVEFPGSADYSYDNSDEWELCLLAMRRALTITGVLYARNTKKRIFDLTPALDRSSAEL